MHTLGHVSCHALLSAQARYYTYCELADYKRSTICYLVGCRLVGWVFWYSVGYVLHARG